MQYRHNYMRLLQWRADGSIFADVEGMLSNLPYTMDEYSESTPDDVILTTESTLTSTSTSDSTSISTSTSTITITKKDIKEIVTEWANVKKSANYVLADRVHETLWDDCRVERNTG